jgi:anaerobic magnesium-protoporphyrin IX monomethyl ester cyclase
MSAININKFTQQPEAIAPSGTKLLLVVLPYLVKTDGDTKKKLVRSFLAFPYGVLTIASYVKRYARNNPVVEILDLNIENSLDPEELFKCEVAKIKPDIIGFSMSYDISFKWLKSVSDIAKKINPNIVTVAGGPAVTVAYEEILADAKSVDALCYSEGELGLLGLVESLEPMKKLDGDPWITKDKIKSSSFKPTAVYEDLDKVINVDYELVDVSAYSMKEAFSPFVKFHEGARQFFIVTSRGCPFECVFCAEPSFHGANMRYANVDLVVAHITSLVKNYGLTVLTIYDDQLLMNKQRAKELFLKLAPLKIRVEMPNGVTLSYIDEEMAFLMKQAGVDTIFLAIESGSKRVLHEIIKKPLAFDRVKPTVKMLQDNGIFATAFFVIGLPGESDEERMMNRDFIIDAGFDWAFFNYATPLRGSELFKICKEKGWIEEKYLALGMVDLMDYVIRAPNMNVERIKRDMFLMNLDVNFVNNRCMRVGNFATAISSFEEVISRHETQPFAHYFLANAYEAVNESDSRIWKHRKKFNDIIADDAYWMDSVRHFNLKLMVNELATLEATH